MLEELDLQGALVSIDAIACSAKTTEIITAKGGHYMRALKKNQKQLYEQVSEHMVKLKDTLPSNEWQDFGSGRIEKRVCYVYDHLDLLDDLACWPGIKQVVMVEASREKNGLVQNQTRFYLSSLLADPATANKQVRNHWGIENKLHWMLDVVFSEDKSRTRTGNAPENMATLRKSALQLLNRQTDKQSIKSRRNIAAWNNEYLLQILRNLRF